MSLFIAKAHSKKSFEKFKKYLNDTESLDIVLDQTPNYLIWIPRPKIIDWSSGLQWTQFFGYNYKEIRADRNVRNREIIEYLYHPDRIAKWINAGNDIEDYLP